MTPPAASRKEALVRTGLTDALGWTVLAIPFFAALTILLRTSINIPFEDDYDAIGEFLEHFIALHGFLPRLGWVLTAQHVDYKLVFLHLVVALEYTLTRQVNFRFLQLLGDLSIPATVLLLWLFLARSGRPLHERIWLFAPPCLLIFSLCYFEGANWAVAGLQSLAVVPFALASILFFTSRQRFTLLPGLLCLTLSAFASANGFAVGAVLAVLLARQRRRRDLFILVAVTLALIAFYSVHLRPAQAPLPAPPMSLVRTVFGTLAFPFIFLGAAAARPPLAAPLGLAIVVAFYHLTRRHWIDLAPATFSAALFCVLTAAGVALTRHSMGPHAAIAGRYRIYSALMLALLFLGAIEVLAPTHPFRNPRWRSALGLATALCALAWLVSSLNAYVHLEERRNVLATHLILWERHPRQLVLIPDEDPVRQLPIWLYMRTRGQDDLAREVKTRLYTPPFGPEAPLPFQTHSPSTRALEAAGP